MNKPPRNSILKKYRSDIIVFLSACFGLWIYFSTLAQNHPDSGARYDLSEAHAKYIATTFLQTEGYVASEEDALVSLHRNPELLNTLQSMNGRKETVALLHTFVAEKLPAYYWEVRWIDKNATQTGMGLNPNQQKNKYVVALTLDGVVWEFKNSTPQSIAQQGKRNALQRILKQQLNLQRLPNVEATAFLNQIKQLSDSTLTGLFVFDIPDSLQIAHLSEQASTIDFTKLLNTEPQRLNATMAVAMARHHLDETTFADLNLQADSVQAISGALAMVRFTSPEPIHQHKIQTEITISSDGTLINLNTSFIPTGVPELAATIAAKQELYNTIILGFWIIVIIFFIVIFFKRYTARAVDVQAALRDALLGGLTIILYNGLVLFNTFLANNQTLDKIVPLLFGVLFTGAGGGLVLFFISGATDTLTRSIWSEKSKTLGLMRRFAIFNQPIGWAWLRGILIAFILLGFYSLILHLFSHIGIQFTSNGFGNVFLKERVGLPILFLLSVGVFNGLLFLGVLLLGFGMLFYRWKKTALMLIGVSILFLFSDLLPDNQLPFSQQWYLILCFGFIITFFFWKYDFLTVFIGYVLFFTLWKLSPAWLIENAPEFIDWWLVWGIIAFIGVLATFFVLKGEEQSLLPAYVPQYMVEMAKQERLQRELEIAHEVQRSFLPTQMPQLEEIELAAICQAAQEVGGDYYDVIPLDNNRLALAIGDVSGKGIQAAFFMTLVKGFLQSLGQEIQTPAGVLKKLNHLFIQNSKRGVFISMIYGILDVKTKTFTFARAGHNPVLLKRSPSQVASVLQPQGLAIGLVDGEKFDNLIEEETIQLRAGDMLVLYTDGFSEAMDKHRKLYSIESLQAFISEKGHLSAEEMIQVLTEDVNNFADATPQHDDMTMLVVKIRQSNSFESIHES